MRIYVYAQWTDTVTVSEKVIVNPYITYLGSSDTNVLEIIHSSGSPNYVMQGTGGGTANLELKRGTVTIATREITVISDINDIFNSEIELIGGIMTTHNTFGDYNIEIDENSNIYICSNVSQSLTAELDAASIHIFVKLKDGSVFDLSDELQLNYSSLYPSDLEVTSVDHTVYATSSTKPAAWGVVAIGAQNHDWKPMVQVDWYIPGTNRLRASGYV